MRETVNQIHEYLEQASGATQVKALNLILRDPEGTIEKEKETGMEYLAAETQGMSIEDLKESYPPMDEIEARNLYMGLTEEQRAMIPDEDRETLEMEVRYYLDRQEEMRIEEETNRQWEAMTEEQRDEEIRRIVEKNG